MKDDDQNNEGLRAGVGPMNELGGDADPSFRAILGIIYCLQLHENIVMICGGKKKLSIQL
jgi:hypothetical protein